MKWVEVSVPGSRMVDNSPYYIPFGRKAAKLSFAFPGLGQLYNKHYFKGTLVVSIFSFGLALLFMLLLRSAGQPSPALTGLLSVLPAVIWSASVFDAYHSAIEQRKRDARRYNVQVATTIRGYDANNTNFEEVTFTKNVSRLGACLILSRELMRGSHLFLEFEGNEKVRARVVWVREAANNQQQHLAGMELLSPLRQFE
jgi:hypothetical protein